MVWRVVRRLTRFETLSGRRVELWYDPSLASRPDLATHLELWEAALAAVEKVFGFALSKTVIILLFASDHDADRTFGGSAGGRAFGWQTIAVGAEILDQAHPEETMRHELAHLFSHRWSRRRSRLKREGLAEWVNGTRDGVAIDACALGYLLLDEEGGEVQLAHLLDPNSWTVDRHRNYVLAGSFTGFLIGRFGWETYRRFFAHARDRDFEAILTEIFGWSLRDADHEWREDLLRRRSDFEPGLSQSLAETRIERAYDREEFARCVEEVETMIRDGYATTRALWFGASAHRALHNHGAAIELLEHALQVNDGWLERHRARAWLELGQICDLDGRGEAATKAYRRALEEAPGYADGDAVQVDAEEALRRQRHDGT